jgi:hypothetical protein
VRRLLTNSDDVGELLLGQLVDDRHVGIKVLEGGLHLPG